MTWRADCLKRVRERIEAGADGEHPWQADGEFGVGDDGDRQHLRVEDDPLAVGALVDHHASSPDLAAGARRRRDRNHGSDRIGIGTGPPVTDVLEVPERAGLPGVKGDDLADVERRATTHGDDAVVTTSPERCDAGIDVAPDRVGSQVAEHRRRKVGVGHGCTDGGNGWEIDESGVGHDQRVGDPGIEAGLAVSETRPEPLRIAVG